MTKLTLPAPVKLNLFLHITGIKDDGYHLLQSVFQLLTFGDQLSFSPAGETGLHFSCSEPSLINDDNLVLRAANALLPFAFQELAARGLHIHLQKWVPTGSGLGGGSSDAATTLLVLNKLWGCHLSNYQLQALGNNLGSDVPVFVAGNSAFAEGTGEQLTPITLPELHFVVLTPPTHVDTGEIFRHSELTTNSKTIKIRDFLSRLPLSWSDTSNDTQAITTKLYPSILKAIALMKEQVEASQLKVHLLRMTGTGSSVFAALSSALEAKQLEEKIKCCLTGELAGSRIFTSCGCNLSPLHHSMNILAQEFDDFWGVAKW